MTQRIVFGANIIGYDVFIYDANPLNTFSFNHIATITHDWEQDKTKVSYIRNV